VNYFGRRAIRKLIEHSKVDFELDDSGDKYHHSKILAGPLVKFLKFKTGYYFEREIS
jgi:hypothetical protein